VLIVLPLAGSCCWPTVWPTPRSICVLRSARRWSIACRARTAQVVESALNLETFRKQTAEAKAFWRGRQQTQRDRPPAAHDRAGEPALVGAAGTGQPGRGASLLFAAMLGSALADRAARRWSLARAILPILYMIRRRRRRLRRLMEQLRTSSSCSARRCGRQLAASAMQLMRPNCPIPPAPSSAAFSTSRTWG